MRERGTRTDEWPWVMCFERLQELCEKLGKVIRLGTLSSPGRDRLRVILSGEMS